MPRAGKPRWNVPKRSRKRTRPMLARFAPTRDAGRIVQSLATAKTHVVIRSVVFATKASTNVGNNYIAYSFQLSDLPSYTEMTALFDQYKIDEVSMHFISQAGGACGPYSLSTPDLILAVDLDDNNVPTAVNDLLQYENCQIQHANRDKHLTLKPRFATAAYSGAFTSYANNAGWIDCASPSVQHYGVKGCITQDSGAAGDRVAYNIYATYKISFRSIR